ITIAYDFARKVRTMTHDDSTHTVHAFETSVMVDLSATGYDTSHLAPLHSPDDMVEDQEDALGNHTYLVRDRFGNVTQVTDADSNVTVYKRNGDGQLTEVDQPDPDGADPL